jgi:polysaccharide biosynthesis protein PslG
MLVFARMLRVTRAHSVAAVALACAVVCVGTATATSTDPSPAAAPQAAGAASEPVAKAKGAACNARRRGGFVGLGDDSFVHLADRDCVLGLQAQAGAGVVRVTFDWAAIETRPGVYDFSRYDVWMRSVASHRMRVLPILFNTPSFRGRQSRRGTYPPRDFDAYARFAAAAVGRYGPNGSFFTDNPDVPKVPIGSWQVWNEPNLPVYWLPRPNPREYVQMLRAAYQAIKAVDARAEVVTAGIPASVLSGAIRFERFVGAMYKAKGARSFDTLAPNAYGRTAQDVIGSIGSLRKLMNRNGDRRGKIWITEVGWGTGGPRSRFNIGERRQAVEIPKLLRGLYRARGRLRLRGVVYFGWQDLRPYAPKFKDMWGLHTGLFKLNGRPKPAYRTFKRVAPSLR